jgi:hypothetical protein
MKKPIALAVLLLVFWACKPTQSAVDKVCEALIAYNDTPLEEQICATMDDILAIGNFIVGSRASASRTAAVVNPDAGAPKSAPCKPLPHTDLCVTDEELARAIKARRVGAK